ncbi:hypothetical protein NE237_015720 [Protea cynaroides]|uniref:Ternary complex factor MIP1 leucine-zipper domain-containing protein n=1 Tax=Protea cynaroides TaxID=273540 RepID=A0A9Q0KEK7_9MAGN|nr:hypothetical protein NE237_015720 [Protea cynaroides]
MGHHPTAVTESPSNLPFRSSKPEAIQKTIISSITFLGFWLSIFCDSMEGLEESLPSKSEEPHPDFNILSRNKRRWPILQAELDDELKLNQVLQCALHGQIVSRPSLSSLLPIQVQVLLAELAMVEEEIIFLETKVEELSLCLDQEIQNREHQLQPLQQQQKHCGSGVASHRKQEDHEQSLGRLHYKADFGGQRLIRERKASLGSASEIHVMSSSRLNGEGYGETDQVAEKSRCNGRNQTQNLLDEAMVTEKPNRLSEELIKCLIGIFLKLNQSSDHFNCEGSASISKLSLSCINSKGQKSKPSFNCNAPTCFMDDNTSILNPYGILSDFDGPVRDVGQYKNFIQFTRNSMDLSRVSDCLPAIGKLRLFLNFQSPPNEYLSMK